MSTSMVFRSRAIRRVGLALLLVVLGATVALRGSAKAIAAGAVTCGQTITASIVVTNDLTNCPGDGLVIAHSSVTLNLNGHSITGSGVGAGIKVINFSTVVIETGSISGFSKGLDFEEMVGSTAKSLRISGNATGVYAYAGGGNTLTANTVFGNTALGISIGLNYKATVTNNLSESNGTFGFDLQLQGASTVSGNKALNNVGIGIEYDSSAAGDTFTSNTTNGNGTDGFRSTGGFGTFKTNKSNYNGQLGFNLAPGVIDGAGNVAAHNGTAKQCVNVICP